MEKHKRAVLDKNTGYVHECLIITEMLLGQCIENEVFTTDMIEMIKVRQRGLARISQKINQNKICVRFISFMVREL